MNVYLPWIEKYRPNNINDIISHDQNIKTIKKLLENNVLPHLLFHGSPGTGKTSTILSIANEMYGSNIKLMTMKLDASDDRGINSVREDIKGFAERSNMFCNGVKLIILDEADSMTFDAQFALRRIIEKYSETIRFCLICNYENKIIPAIRSRCASFRFSNINKEHIITKLHQITKAENINLNEETVETIAILAKGDLRKAINILQSITMYLPYKEKNDFDSITPNLCYNIVGIPSPTEIKTIISVLKDKYITFTEALNVISKIFIVEGYSLSIVLKELILELLNNHIHEDKIEYIISDLSDIENMVTKSTFSTIYISALVGLFKK